MPVSLIDVEIVVAGMVMVAELVIAPFSLLIRLNLVSSWAIVEAFE
jgi:hypothetical protein